MGGECESDCDRESEEERPACSNDRLAVFDFWPPPPATTALDEVPDAAPAFGRVEDALCVSGAVASSYDVVDARSGLGRGLLADDNGGRERGVVVEVRGGVVGAIMGWTDERGYTCGRRCRR